MNEDNQFPHGRKQYVMEEKIDRLEHHFKVYKDDMIDVKTILKNVETSLVGSSLNGNKGIVSLLDSIETRVDCLERKQSSHEETISNYRNGLKILIGGIVSFFLWFFTKDK